jgi:cyclophilin family peptidyl-prolyl cis-trans isomerase/HEAT repeat protein
VAIAELEAAGRLGVAALARIADDTDRARARAAIRGLGRIGGAEAEARLARLLGARDVATRTEAARAAGLSGGVALIPHLIAAWPRAGGAERVALIEALGRLGDARALPLAASALAASDPAVRTAGVVALGVLGRRGIPIDGATRDRRDALAADLDPAVRHAVAFALVREHEPPPGTSAPAVLALARDRDPEIRALALAAIPRRALSSSPAVHALTVGLDDRDWRVRVEAARGLLARGERGAELLRTAREQPVAAAVRAIEEELGSASIEDLLAATASAARGRAGRALELLTERAGLLAPADRLRIAELGGAWLTAGEIELALSAAALVEAEPGAAPGSLCRALARHPTRAGAERGAACLAARCRTRASPATDCGAARSAGRGDLRPPGSGEGTAGGPNRSGDLARIIGRQVRWVLATDRGRIEIALDPATAPWAVAAIVRLTERGFYDGLVFHRVVPGFVIQGGDPDGTGWGGPGFVLPGEASARRFERGTVGIADAGPDTGGSQFFITHARTPHLEGRYTAIGEVVRGMAVVDRIQVGDRIRTARAYVTSAPAQTR